MSAQQPNLRDRLNGSMQPQALADVLKDLRLGDLLALLIRGLTPTETGVVPSAHLATLANVPTVMLQVNATTATVTGIKTLFIAPTSGPGAYVPLTGQCVWWPGTKKVLFAAADAVTAASFTYSVGTEAASILPRLLGQNDSVF
jgi:hypothetical protein